MPTFNFDDGSSNINQGGTDPTLVFVEDGVTFTLSTDDANGGNEILQYDPTVNQNFNISDQTTGAAGNFTLTFATTGGFDRFAGTNLEIVFGSGSQAFNVTFIAATGTDVVITGVHSGTINVGTLGIGDFFSGIRFTSLGGPPLITVNSITTQSALVCYLEGTRIATPEGDVAVEDIKAGDLVSTADGRAIAVEWLGIQPVDLTTAQPAKTHPVCIKAGALAEGVPSRDLYVSPNHAIELDGRLYDAHALINGRSIYQVVDAGKSLTYYHVETAAHELILAENCPAETFLDYATRDNFINGGERIDAPIIDEMPLPRVSAKRMVARSVVDRLSTRADALGLALSRAA
ncbi:Hint domain-containing protein [Pseudaestuariivita atlantica]|uniref:Hint domain-containing protein n=1 Tax=Pseudaestuariivita atlantica TaxID=1317121 RepID=UPI00067B4BFC|nr:Hint domain-containing protein [Pseudaestuariivita atlantica]